MDSLFYSMKNEARLLAESSEDEESFILDEKGS